MANITEQDMKDLALDAFQAYSKALRLHPVKLEYELTLVGQSITQLLFALKNNEILKEDQYEAVLKNCNDLTIKYQEIK